MDRTTSQASCVCVCVHLLHFPELSLSLCVPFAVCAFVVARLWCCGLIPRLQHDLTRVACAGSCTDHFLKLSGTSESDAESRVEAQ